MRLRKIKEWITREDQYPAIAALNQEWLDKMMAAARTGDEDEYRACDDARRSLANWVVYATVGKDRFSPDIVRMAAEGAEKAAAMRRRIESERPEFIVKPTAEMRRAQAEMEKTLGPLSAAWRDLFWRKHAAYGRWLEKETGASK